MRPASTDATTVRFGILILNYNGMSWLPELLSSLASDGYANKQVYVIDNASTDGSLGLLQREWPEVEVIALSDNLGYAMAYNCAMQTAFDDGCDWVLWQNADTRVRAGWLGRLTEVIATDPALGILGCCLLAWKSDRLNEFLTASYPSLTAALGDPTGEPIDVPWVQGSAMAVNRALVDHIGGLDPEWFMYWEDADYCRRARFHGWRVAVVPGASVEHYGGASAAGLDWAGRLSTRNYYRYQLTNPEGTVWGNVYRTLRLFVTQANAATRNASVSALGREWSGLTKTLCGARSALLKRRGDRSRVAPAILTPELTGKTPPVRMWVGRGDKCKPGTLPAAYGTVSRSTRVELRQ